VSPRRHAALFCQTQRFPNGDSRRIGPRSAANTLLPRCHNCLNQAISRFEPQSGVLSVIGILRQLSFKHCSHCDLHRGSLVGSYHKEHDPRERCRVIQEMSDNRRNQAPAAQ
jgi:hypothetical protein